MGGRERVGWKREICSSSMFFNCLHLFLCSSLVGCQIHEDNRKKSKDVFFKGLSANRDLELCKDYPYQ